MQPDFFRNKVVLDAGCGIGRHAYLASEFGAKDVEELKPMLPAALSRRVVLISGRDLHWYGVRMVTGLKSLAALLARVRAAAI